MYEIHEQGYLQGNEAGQFRSTVQHSSFPLAMRNKENIHMFAHRRHLRYSSVARFPHFLRHLICAGGQTGVVHNRLGTSLRHLNVMVDQFKGQCCSLCPKVYCEKSSTLGTFKANPSNLNSKHVRPWKWFARNGRKLGFLGSSSKCIPPT